MGVEDNNAAELKPLSGGEVQPRVIKMAPQTRGQKVRKCITNNLLTMLTVGGVVGGGVIGFTLRASKPIWTPREVMYVQFIGEIFLNMLKGLIIPLLVSSIVSAIGSLDLSLSSKIGFRAIAYYVATTSLAVFQGIVLVSVIQPGRYSGNENITRKGTSRNVTTADTLMDLARSMFPPNLVQACTHQYRTVLTFDDSENHKVADVLKQDPKNLYTWTISNEFTEGSNVLGLVVFAVVLGIAIGRMGEMGKPLLKVFESLGEAMMVITNWVIWISPLGVLFLVCSKILSMDSITTVFHQLGMYFFTVLLGLFCHGFVVVPLIYTIGTRKMPFRFIANMTQAIVTAFGTASSSASLPVSMSCLEEKNHVDERVSRFVMPIGATINMDGTALYEAVAALFIAQVREVPYSFGSIIAVSITATFASIGAAGIPQAGLVTMVMVLDTVGLPAEDVTLIIAVDWLLDRFRTTINVLGDSMGAGLVAHLSKGELDAIGEPETIKMKKRASMSAPNSNTPEISWNTTPM
ncbi:LOW QUALITY PROTEIN: excitatory amino acid transporter 3-like [Homalodisca vitripennis]|uniref:LOW QUALITY PROTEIN: excitatory amino acid transporter 3-like n=1 Tax=Homalodisca vitripennis TaxID=197043 RepID=UPI001EEC1457|nr:LOW QUALITY PROTEIN: excitatory amino acid transporter 3-like [Homalodisca vitripennis]